MYLFKITTTQAESVLKNMPQFKNNKKHTNTTNKKPH